MIPKIIWQTHQWKEDKIPYPYNKVSRVWKNLYLDWDYNYYDRFERIRTVKELRPEMLDFYLDLSKVRQSDYWRYLVLYEYGGLYVDMDMLPTGAGLYKFDDELAEYDVIIEPADGDKNIANAYMLFAPKHPILKNILDNYHNLITQKGFEGSDMIEIWGNEISSYEDQSSILYEGFGFREINSANLEFPYNEEINYNGKMRKYSDIDFIMRD